MNKETKLPNCVGIIMDGNRRWALERGLSPFLGHRAGGETLKKVVDWINDLGIRHAIFYTFSSENWKRPEREVSYLLNLIGEFLKREFEYFNKKGIVIHCAGDLSRFSAGLQKRLRESEEKTRDNPGAHIYFALNYGGRQEILSAVKNIVMKNPPPDSITEEYFSKHLQTGQMPDPDLIIRTSGEMRLSGFLPWQSVYSELFFTNTLWPDFSKEEFSKIIEEYANRERRIGK